MRVLMHYGDHEGVPDCLVCDMPVVEWEYATEDADQRTSTDPRPCGAEVYVTWSFAVPVIHGEPTFPADVAKAAVSSLWQMACTEGHVHALSHDDESAEQFDPTVVGP